MDYYVYRHIRLDKNVPFYIGVGTVNKSSNTYYSSHFRAFDFKKRNRVWKRVYSKTDIRVEIIYESDSYAEILEKEKEFIKIYGSILESRSNPLVNLTEGGEGCLGFKHTEESKKKMGETKRSRTYVLSKKLIESRSKRFTGENNPSYGRTEPTKNTCKPVLNILTNTAYDSLANACRELKLNYKAEHQRILRNSSNKKFNYI